MTDGFAGRFDVLDSPGVAASGRRGSRRDNRVPFCRELTWLTGRVAPGHKTIGDFRCDSGPAIRKTFTQFIELCRRIGVLKGDCVAIDGSKFRAVTNRVRNFTKGKIASRVAHLEADVERCIDEMVRIDRQEEGQARTEKVEKLGQRYGRIRKEIHRLKTMEQALADAPDGQISRPIRMLARWRPAPAERVRRLQRPGRGRH